MKRAIFLDRDNTLIDNDADLGDPDGVKLMKAAAVGVAALRGLGYQIVVVTNQGGVARGQVTEADVDAVHERINALLTAQANGAKVDRFYFCPYSPEGTVPRYRRDHPWRKPQPGMLLQAAEDLKLDLSLCWMIGDAERDIEAGRAAGVRTIRIGPGRAGQGELPLDPDRRADFNAVNLIEAARIVAQQIRPEAVSLGGDDAASRDPSISGPGRRSTYPATEQLGTTRSSSTIQGKRSRPFKPWSIQPVTDDDARAGEPSQSTRRMTLPRPEDAPREEADSPAASPPMPEPRVTHTRSDRGSESDHAPAAAPPTPLGEPLTEHGDVEAGEADRPAAPDSVSSVGPAGATRTDHLLTQILREMKNARAHDADWSMMKTAAVGVVQPLAAFCALMAVINVGRPTTMLGWLMGAVFGQLLVVTLLLLHWQK